MVGSPGNIPLFHPPFSFFLPSDRSWDAPICESTFRHSAYFLLPLGAVPLYRFRLLIYPVGFGGRRALWGVVRGGARGKERGVVEGDARQDERGDWMEGQLWWEESVGERKARERGNRERVEGAKGRWQVEGVYGKAMPTPQKRPSRVHISRGI